MKKEISTNKKWKKIPTSTIYYTFLLQPCKSSVSSASKYQFLLFFKPLTFFFLRTHQLCSIMISSIFLTFLHVFAMQFYLQSFSLYDLSLQCISRILVTYSTFVLTPHSFSTHSFLTLCFLISLCT